MTAPFLANGEARVGRFPPWAWPLVPIAVSGFFVSALTWFRLRGAVPSDDDGPLAHLVIALYRGIGFESLFMVAVLVLAWSSIAFLTGRVERPWIRLARIAALGLCLSILVSLRVDGTVPASAGTVGAFFAARLSSVFGTTLSILLVAIASLASLVLATDFFFYRQFEGLARATGPEARPSTAHVGVEREAVAELESLRLDLPEPAVASEDRAGEPTILMDDDELARAVDEAVLDLEREADERRDSTEDAERADEAPESDASEAEAVEARTAAETDEAAEAESESESEDAEDREAEDGDEVEAEEDEVWASAEDEEAVEEEPESEGEDAEDWEGEEDDEVEAEEDEVRASAEDEEGDEEESESEDLEAAEEPREIGDREPAPEAVASVEEPEVAEAAAGEDRSWVVPRPAGGQQSLFATGVADAELVAEAEELVVEYRRASVNFLKRRLRVSQDEAVELMAELQRRGVIECEDGAKTGRVLGPAS